MLSAHLPNVLSRYPDKIANAKWEVKELGIEHNGYASLSSLNVNSMENIVLNLSIAFFACFP
jgi:hypothetical protein